MGWPTWLARSGTSSLLDPPDLEVKTKKKRKRLMSNKNLIRKGLAIVASASLALAGVVGISSAANAAPSSLVIESSYGATSAIQASKTQNGVLGYEFNLNVQAPGVAVTDEVLYLVEATDIATASVTVDSRWVPTLATASSSADSDTVYRTSADAVGGQVSHTIRAAGSANGLVIQPSYTTARLAELHQFTINLSATYAATKTVTITPFVDSINNDQIDSSEVQGTPIVLTLHKPSELTFSSQLVSPTTSSQVLRSDVSVNKDVNIAQWLDVSSSAIRNQFYVNGTNQGGTNVLVAYSSTTERASAYSTSVSIPTGAIASVQQSVAGGTYAASGTTATVSAGNVATVGAVTNVGGNVETTNFRLGDGSFTVDSTITVKAGATLAGQTVTFTVAENAVNSLASAGSVTAGGKTLVNSSATTAQSITVDVVTDADGVATLPVSYTGVVLANAIKITASATSAAGGTISSAAKTYTATASLANAVVDLGKSSDSAVRYVAPGGAVSVAYRVVDQFGLTPVGTYQASVSLSSITSANAVYSTIIPVVNGAFTVAFADNSTGASAVSSAYSIDVVINKQQTDLSYSTTGGIAGPHNDAIVAVRSSVQSAATLTLAADDTTDVARSAVSMPASIDTRVTKSSVALPSLSVAATLSGTALNSTGTNAVGVPVTLSAAGVLFEQNGNYGLGSLTVYTDTSGVWAGVQIYSNKVGAQTITATSGSATKTLSVAFASTSYADGSALSITAPKSIRNGRTLTMRVALVDKFGNPVSADATRVKVSYAGPGFEIIDPATAALASATGVYTLRVLLGTGDTGVATMTAVFDADADLATADTDGDRLTATASTWVGPIANATAAKKKDRVIIEAYRAKGRTVSVFVAGERVASYKANKANFRKVVKGVKSGNRNVEVKLSGRGEDFKGTITIK